MTRQPVKNEGTAGGSARRGRDCARLPWAFMMPEDKKGKVAWCDVMLCGAVRCGAMRWDVDDNGTNRESTSEESAGVL